jgi:hypothetical protein
MSEFLRSSCELTTINVVAVRFVPAWRTEEPAVVASEVEYQGQCSSTRCISYVRGEAGGLGEAVQIDGGELVAPDADRR